jgi:hypothetical protein
LLFDHAGFTNAAMLPSVACLCLRPGISKVQDDEVGDGTTSGVTAAQAASNNAACCHFC